MPCRRSLVVTLLFAAAAAASAHAGPYRAPRAADGHPDLSGVWTNTSLTHLQRPPGLKTATLTEAEAAAWEKGPSAQPPREDPVGQATSEWIEREAKLARVDGQARTAWITDPPDGRLPYSEAGRKALAAAQARAERDFDGPESRPAPERCLMAPAGMAGPPLLNAAYNANYRIVQTKGHVAIFAEMNHDLRIVPLGEVRHAPGQIRAWLGDSIGHWEGETLVVETIGFHPQASWRPPTQLYTSPDARITERFTRVGPDEIRYAFEVDDPAVFSRPWRGEMPLRRANAQMFEFACHEGNYALPGILAGARREEAARAAAGR